MVSFIVLVLFSLFVFCFLILLPPVHSANLPPSLIRGANYLATRAMVPEGQGIRSRCDYHWIKGQWIEYEPAWHTGQMILALVDAYEVSQNVTQKNLWLSAAKQAGQWWSGLVIKSPPAAAGMIDALALGETQPLPEYVVLSTVTDGSHGLVRLANVTDDANLRKILITAARWSIDNMYLPEPALFYDCMDPRTGEVMKKWTPFFPNETHPTIFQVARPNNEGYFWLDAYEMSGDKSFLDVFLRICDGLVGYQDKNGIWMQFDPNDASSGFVHPRFNLWYAESLIEAYDLTKNQTYLQAAALTLRTYTRFQRSDGAFFYKNYILPSGSLKFHRDSVCGSGLSFAGVLWMRLSDLGYSEFDDNIALAASWLEKNQFAEDHSDPNIAGAFLETRSRESWTDPEEYVIIVRGLATSFGVRFFAHHAKWVARRTGRS